MVKILITESENYSKEAIKILESTGKVYKKNLTYKNLLKQISEYDVIVTKLGINFDKAILSEARKLKIIASPTTGLNHLDQDYLKKRKVQILSLKGEKEFLETISATAELNFGLIIALMRNLKLAIDDVKLGNWNRKNFVGPELQKKTIGIIGLGRIGRKLAFFCESFGMKVIYFDKVVNEAYFKKIKSLKSLVSQSDIISLNISSEVKNKNFINKDIISSFKKGSYFINTSRGFLIDENYLANSLKEKRINGVALDVLSKEYSNLKKNKFFKLMNEGYNVIITPHIGGASFESMKLTEIFIAKKIKKVIKKLN